MTGSEKTLEDGRFGAQPPPHDQSKQQDRERANLDARFPLANKIVEERILDKSGQQQD